MLINAISSETNDFDFNFIDMKRDFFTTYLPFYVIKSVKLGLNRAAQGGVMVGKKIPSLENYTSRADYAFISAKPKVVNTKFTAPSTDNDYGDDEESNDAMHAKAVNSKESFGSTVGISAKCATNLTADSSANDMIKLKKGVYMYEDLSCLNIIVPNERF